MDTGRPAAGRSAGRRDRALRRIARGALIAAVAVASAGAALTAWGATDRSVGPLETRLSLVPSLRGGIVVEVPPLGTLGLATHSGPLRIGATVTGIDPGRARALLRSPHPGRTATAQIAADSREALAAAAARAAVVSLLASAAACGIVFRRPGAAVGGAAVTAVALATSAAVAGATLRTEALTEPTFKGLLQQAPALVGRVEDFGAYSGRMARLTANVAQVYSALGTLPAADDPASARVLWVSDIHNNPAAFAVMEQLVKQFDVSAVVDTGDIVDAGTPVENRALGRIGTLGVPYLYVRGNHDSAATQAAVAAQRGAVVLDGGRAVEVAGIRFAGIGDPLFRPNKAPAGETEANGEKLDAAGERLLAAVRADPAGADVAVAHNPRTLAPLAGTVPLALSGHVHERRRETRDGTLELAQGSSGGAGLRALDRGGPLPMQMSVLTFDADGGLLALDDITVGSLGDRSVTVERHTPGTPPAP